jgi:hypothetical protein
MPDMRGRFGSWEIVCRNPDGLQNALGKLV